MNYDGVTTARALANLIKAGVTQYTMPGQIYSTAGDSGNGYPYGQHIKAFIEPNAGAHYYLESQFRSTYFNESCVVDLSKVKVNTANNRNAYISLTMLASGTRIHGCDIGLGYMDNDRHWKAATWCPDHKRGGTVNCDIASQYGTNLVLDGKKIKMEIWCVNDPALNYDFVIGKFFDVTGMSDSQIDQIGETSATENSDIARIMYRFPMGEIFTTDNYKCPVFRCKRFMSLVPKNSSGTTDDPDGSFLEATMERLQLHELNTKKIVPWSMRHPHTAYAWGVQTNNMTLSLGQSVGGQYRDVIRIEHDTRTH